MNHTTERFSRTSSFRDANYSNWCEAPKRTPLVKRVMAWTYVFASILIVYVVIFQGAPK